MVSANFLSSRSIDRSNKYKLVLLGKVCTRSGVMKATNKLLLLLAFLISTVFAANAEEDRKRGGDGDANDNGKEGEEVIYVGKRPPPGAVLFKPEPIKPQAEGDDKRNDRKQNVKDENKQEQAPAGSAKNPEKPAKAGAQDLKDSPKGTNKDQPTAVKGSKKDAKDEKEKEKDEKDDYGAPTRLFRPRYRNSADSAASSSLQNFALISFGVIVGLLLL